MYAVESSRESEATVSACAPGRQRRSSTVASHSVSRLLHLPVQVLHVQIANLLTQCRFRDRNGVGELEVAPRTGVELRPAGQAAAIGIAGLCKVGPIGLQH